MFSQFLGSQNEDKFDFFYSNTVGIVRISKRRKLNILFIDMDGNLKLCFRNPIWGAQWFHQPSIQFGVA